MGCTESKVHDLLCKMDWRKPEYAAEMEHPALVEYLREFQLEVVLPRHAPQMDICIGDRKQQQYPRPAFIHEGYKMHIALIGPSAACKRQFVEFLPKMAHVFQGPSVKLAPGREAVPHYFLDPTLHRMVLWELPEITFKQSAENYIRELGMMYIDCVFILFSDKYLLSDIYCKIVVAMAIHGIPFFVICTQSSENVSAQEMQRIKAQFQQKDISGIRIFNPYNPADFLQELLHDFFKEISWNRGAANNNKEVTKDCNEAVLGSTVRLKNLEKRPELNGRCGVCIGYDSSKDRYWARLTSDGVETDISLKASSFSVLKPKLTEQLVRIHDLVSRPELNGRYGYADAFLRETERYRVFIPDKPGRAFSIALKADNLEKVDAARDAVPVKDEPAAKALPSGNKASAKAPPAKSASGTAAPAATTKASSKAFDPPARDKPAQGTAGSGTTNGSSSTPTEPPPFAIGARVEVHGTSREDLNGLSAEVKLYDPASGRVEVQLDEGRTLRFKPVNLRKLPEKKDPARQAPVDTTPKRAAAELDGNLAEDLPNLFGKPVSSEADKKPDDGSDLMSRIFSAEQDKSNDDSQAEESRGKTCLEAEEEAFAEEADAEAAGAAAASQAAADATTPEVNAPEERGASMTTSAPPAPQRRLQLSLKGLLAMRVWAVVGDPEEAEEIIDHLMDCGKTVFSVSSSSGAHFASTAELNSNPGLPKADVLAFVEPTDASAVQAGAEDAARLGLRGVLLHPEAAAFSADAMDLCRDAGLTVHAADILSEVQPGAGIAVAPLD